MLDQQYCIIALLVIDIDNNIIPDWLSWYENAVKEAQ